MRIPKIILTLTFAAFFSCWAANGELPIRSSSMPETSNGVPYVQIGIEVKPELIAELFRRVEKIPDVEIRDTVISLPGAKEFWLNEKIALARPDAIVSGREFAHIHPDGSLHASLSPELSRGAVRNGWAIPHPWSKNRKGWGGFVMIFTPASMEELNVVSNLVLESYNFITGQRLSVDSLI